MPIRPAEEATVITYTTADAAYDLPETTQIDIVGTYRGSLLRKMSTPGLLATKQWNAYGSPLLYTVWQESDWAPLQSQGWFLKNFKDKEHTHVPKDADTPVDRDGISADSETINLFATKETETMATTKNRNADLVPDTTTQTAITPPKAAAKRKTSRKAPVTPVTILTADEVFAEKRDEIAAQVDTDPMPELIAAAVTDKAADEAPATPVDWDTDPGEDGPAEDEATPPPADDVAPPADDTDAGLMDLAARIVSGDADTQMKVLFLRDLLTKDDATIAAAIDAQLIRLGKDLKPATTTGNGHGRNGSTGTTATATGSKSVPVVCSHCDKHFLGRANQVECRVCSDYEKTHGTPRPLNGKTPATPTTPKAAAKKKAGSTHRLH